MVKKGLEGFIADVRGTIKEDFAGPGKSLGWSGDDDGDGVSR